MLISYILRKMRIAQWWVYVALAAPFAWYGLLYAAVHPSLALCFVVPFLPLTLDKEKDEDDLSDSDSDDDEARGHVHSPLHDFEHDVKGFVDFVVLFLFGLCNAGVNLNGVGGYSLVIFLSLLLGKTAGLVGRSMLASSLGFPRPDGMSFRELIVVGIISSVGLTVSLFIAGEAYADEDGMRDQAKFGALLSLLPALLLIMVTTLFPSFKQYIISKEPNEEMDQSKCTMPAIEEDESVHHAIDVSLDPEEEDLEAVIVQNMEHALRRIHRVEHRCERKHGITRSQSLVIMDGLPKTASAPSLTQRKPRNRSPSPQLVPVRAGLKRNQSSEAMISQLIEKHITKEGSPPLGTPRPGHGRPPRPPRASSAGSLLPPA